MGLSERTCGTLFGQWRITVRPLYCINRLGTVHQKCRTEGHQLKKKEYRYYDGMRLCTRDFGKIYSGADTHRKPELTDLWIPFGVNAKRPRGKNFLAFLANRYIQKPTKGLDYYLDAVGVPEYDPVLLVEKTQGRMAEDHKWLEII